MNPEIMALWNIASHVQWKRKVTLNSIAFIGMSLNINTIDRQTVATGMHHNRSSFVGTIGVAVRPHSGKMNDDTSMTRWSYSLHTFPASNQST